MWRVKSRTYCSMSMPRELISSTRAKHPATSRAATSSATPESVSSATSPSSSRASSTRTVPRPCTESVSSVDRASRRPPRAWRATRASASLSYSKPSEVHTNSRRSAMSASEMRWNSRRWQRESTVSGIFCGSVVHSTNTTCAGGSSSVLSSALNAAVVSMWTSSIT